MTKADGGPAWSPAPRVAGAPCSGCFRDVVGNVLGRLLRIALDETSARTGGRGPSSATPSTGWVAGGGAGQRGGQDSVVVQVRVRRTVGVDSQPDQAADQALVITDLADRPGGEPVISEAPYGLGDDVPIGVGEVVPGHVGRVVGQVGVAL